MLSGFKGGLVLSVSFGLVVGGINALPAIAQKQRPNMWTQVYRSLFGGKPPVPKGAGGSRPLQKSNFCSLLPGQWKRGEAVMLRSRPTWIWRGGVTSLKLENVDQGKVVWQSRGNIRPDADGLRRLVYSGPALEAGKQYRLTIQRQATIPPITLADFRTLEPEQRSRLLSGLYQVQDSAWKAGKRGNELVKARVQFLTQQGLWLDAAQDILMSEATSADWREVQAGVVYETCDKPPVRNVR